MMPAVQADMSLRVEKILPDHDLELSDGRAAHLQGIYIFPEAMSFLNQNLITHKVTVENATMDRYGRVAAYVTDEDQHQSVQEEILQQGWGFVYPAADDEPHLDAWLVDEKVARQAGRGAWPAHGDVRADDAEKLYGRYGFVSGTVVTAARVKNKAYLNFGADWRTDFTIAVAAHDLRAFKKAGLDLLALQGKKLRVRGWVKRDFGPMIAVTDPHQIEILP